VTDVIKFRSFRQLFTLFPLKTGEPNLILNSGGYPLLWLNDGAGHFTDATAGRMPEMLIDFAWDVELLDVDHDYALDVLILSRYIGKGVFLFENDGKGSFTDVTAGRVPQLFRVKYTVRNTDFTPTWPNVAVADLDGDHTLELVMALDSPDYETTPYESKIFLGKNIQPDTAPPVITLVEQVSAPAAGQPILIRARVHDNKSSTMSHDWQSVILKWTADGQTTEIPMQWYGEYLWRSVIDSAPAGGFSYQVCAWMPTGTLPG
jgi:hypothetical protein